MEMLFDANDAAELVGCDRSDLRDMWVSLDDAPALDLRCHDAHNYLPYDLMCKVDTASMACGLEVRCPFVDRELATVALNSTMDQLAPRGQRKGLLRQIARKYLPKEIVDRPKMGFAIPIGEWFRNDDLPFRGSGMKTLLLDHLNSTEPFGPIQLNRKAVQRFIDEHMSCKRDHGQRLFTLLTLSIWARQTNAETHERRNAERSPHPG
jgi:asparagine synthase (glutamine-hydrolysing)